MTTLNIEGRKVKVSNDFLSLSAAEQEATVNEIAQSLSIQPGSQGTDGGAMGQFSAGIAGGLGGLVDFVNPFDAEVWQDTPLVTGSAKDGLRRGMEALNIPVATVAPEGFGENFMRGAGNAASALVPIAKGLQALSKAPALGPAIQAFADDATKALSTFLGSSIEIGAGGLSRASGEQVRDAGGPEWAAQTAELAAPLSIPAAGAAVRGGAQLAAGAAQTLPVARTLTNMGRDVVRGVAPMTDAGAREVAGQRLRDISGGQERAAELADMIDPRDPYGRSPA